LLSHAPLFMLAIPSLACSSLHACYSLARMLLSSCLLFPRSHRMLLSTCLLFHRSHAPLFMLAIPSLASHAPLYMLAIPSLACSSLHACYSLARIACSFLHACLLASLRLEIWRQKDSHPALYRHCRL
jgi:hypothetical protein